MARDQQLPRPSHGFLKVFRPWVRRDIRRHFDGLMVLRSHTPKMDVERPLVVYLNHPSWWDPLVSLVLAHHFWPARDHVAPIDAEALARYPMLRKIGLFGVQRGSAAGARRFLQVGQQVLRQPRGSLWITPSGQFTDPRCEARIEPGLPRLLARVQQRAPSFPAPTVLPLALEYPFWTEKRPQILAAFGAPVTQDSPPTNEPTLWETRLVLGLQRTQADLQAAAVSQDPSLFDTLIAGKGGVHPAYDWIRRARARLSGRSFDPRHRQGPTP